MTCCFLSVSGANCLPARCFVRGPTRWKSLGSIMPPDLWMVAALWLVGCWQAALHSHVVRSVFHLFGPLMKSTDGTLFATDACYKANLHKLAPDTWLWFLVCWDTSLDTMMGIMKCEIDSLEVWIWFVVGIIFNNVHRIKKVTAAYAVSCEHDVCSNNASMVFYRSARNEPFSEPSFFLFCLML